jgi:hypothetical protein
MRPQDSILRSQVLVLEEQFLVHKPRYKRQQTSALIAVHGNRPSSQVLILGLFEYFDHSGLARPSIVLKQLVHEL